MIGEAAAWLIVFLPIAAFALIALARPFAGGGARVSGYAAIAAIGAAFALSIWALRSTLGHEEAVGFASHSWFVVGDPGAGRGFEMTVGFLLDPLTGIMLVVVTGVSLLVQVYSQAYLKGDASYSRYFAYMALFTGSMLGLVTARNLIQLFVFWELVGLSSYLLIGFWHGRPAAADAAKKAFIVTRVGDFGFLLALLYLFAQGPAFAAQGLNPFEIPDLMAFAPSLAGGVAAWLALGLFAGAVGKSAQFPLHTWLPDAMEGPTPVSSLIHAATMVAAGVFLVARAFPLFEAGGGAALNTVALIGGVTALMAASMALVANDIKRVLAYSTISQLGFMFVALGVGLPAVAMFHLFTHAFFKCLLFLSAGSVHHAAHTFDMRYMGRTAQGDAVDVRGGAHRRVEPRRGVPAGRVLVEGRGAGGRVGRRLCGEPGRGADRVLDVRSGVGYDGVLRLPYDLHDLPRRVPGRHRRRARRGEAALRRGRARPPARIAVGDAAPDAAPGRRGHRRGLPGQRDDGRAGHSGALVRGDAAPQGGGCAYRRRCPIVGCGRRRDRPGDADVRTRRLLPRAGGRRRCVRWARCCATATTSITCTRGCWCGGSPTAAYSSPPTGGTGASLDGAADLTAWLGRNTGRALAQLQTGQAQAYGIAAALGAAAFILAYAVVR